MEARPKFVVIIMSAISLSGCMSAVWIKHPNEAFTNSESAPKSERTSDGIGIVSYLNEGYSSVIESRKEDAFKKAHDACNGEYEIIKKLDMETEPMYFSQFDDSTNMVSTYGLTFPLK